MSFRRTVLLTLVGIVLAVTGLEALFDLAWEARRRAAFPPGFDAVAPESFDADLIADLLDIPIVVAVALLAARWLTRRISAPIERLTRAANALAETERSSSVPVPAGDDALSDLAHAFNRMSASVHESLERERAFTRYVSHELRTPLTALSVQLERAELGLVSADTALPAASRQARRMQETLAVLLDLGRASRRELVPRPLRDVIDDVRADVPETEIRSPAPIPNVRVSDALLLSQALRNLMENVARHATGVADVRATIRGRELDVVISDYGPGMPEAASGSQDAQDVGGSGPDVGRGLGLALVRSITTTLGGELHFRNRPDGLDVSLTVPLVTQGGSES